MRIVFTDTYKNYLYFTLPIIFYLLLEWYFKWPINNVVPGNKGVYLQSTTLYICLYLFAMLVGLGINFWQHSKMREDKTQRKLHMIISVAILCLNYIPGKLLIMGSTMSKEAFIEATGLTRVNFKLFDSSQSIVFLLYFLIQFLFVFYTLKRRRLKTTEPAINRNNQ